MVCISWRDSAAQGRYGSESAIRHQLRHMCSFYIAYLYIMVLLLMTSHDAGMAGTSVQAKSGRVYLGLI